MLPCTCRGKAPPRPDALSHLYFDHKFTPFIKFYKQSVSNKKIYCNQQFGIGRRGEALPRPDARPASQNFNPFLIHLRQTESSQHYVATINQSADEMMQYTRNGTRQCLAPTDMEVSHISSRTISPQASYMPHKFHQK